MNVWYFCMDLRATSSNMTEARSIHIMETVRALRAHGHSVDYLLRGDVAGTSEIFLRQRAQKAGQRNPVIRAVRPLLRDLFELYQNASDKNLIESLLREEQVDLVYERASENQSTVSAYTQKYEIPYIVESNAPCEERREYWRAPLYIVAKHLHKAVLQRANAVTVVSTPLREYYGRMGIERDKIFVLPNGVNEKRFSPSGVSRDLRTELGLDGKLVVGFVGNIHPYHGIELFLPLARTFSHSDGNLHFMIAGAGRGREELLSALEQERMGDMFTFVDPVPNAQVPNYIAAMDICILPKFSWYGSPMKIFEYGAMGKAIVAPDQENIRDVFTHGETAFLFEPGKPGALIQAVQEVAKDEHLRVCLGLAAQKHILANHTWAKNAHRILEIHRYITPQAR